MQLVETFLGIRILNDKRLAPIATRYPLIAFAEMVEFRNNTCMSARTSDFRIVAVTETRQIRSLPKQSKIANYARGGNIHDQI